jgi:hypothetical protein
MAIVSMEKMDQIFESALKDEKKKQAFFELVEDFKLIVKGIEKGLETTKGHYGDYLALLSKTDSPAMTYYILRKAGANEFGLNWAYKIKTGIAFE